MTDLERLKRHLVDLHEEPEDGGGLEGDLADLEAYHHDLHDDAEFYDMKPHGIGVLVTTDEELT